MQDCPFCLKQVRQVGAIILVSPAQLSLASQSDPLTGAACVDCLGLIAMSLDGLRNGRINALADKLMLSGAIARN